jgi:three-Cys-motif partner protein
VEQDFENVIRIGYEMSATGAWKLALRTSTNNGVAGLLKPAADFWMAASGMRFLGLGMEVPSVTTASSQSNDPFFDTIRDWSQIKLRILEKYCSAYLNKRGSFHSTIYYVDGFAGAGHYGPAETDPEAGSPLLVARLAQTRRDTRKPGKLVCLLSEHSPDRCKRLERSLSRDGIDQDLAHVLCGKFQDQILSILGMMKPGPAICFLDPFGVRGISPGELRPLLSRPDTEFLLNLNTGILLRMTGFKNSASKEREAKLANVSRTLGEDPATENPEWLEMQHRFDDSRQWEAWAAQRYMDQLMELGPHLRYAMAYEVRAKFHGRPKYYLVFASRSVHAFPIMNDILFAEEENLFAETEAVQPSGQTTLWGPLREQERKASLAELAEEVCTYGLSHQGVNREQLIQHFTYERLGEYLKKDWRRTVELLIRQGRIRRGQGPIDKAPLEFV